MAHEEADHGIMAELAKLWEEDGDLSLHNQAGATCQHRRPAAAAEDGPALSDPFLLPGDEQTWEPEDWFLDPATLMAAPKVALSQIAPPCCQALKRRRLPPEIMPALQGPRPTSQRSASPAPTAAPAAAAAAAGHQQSSCCNFQLPASHLPGAQGPAPVLPFPASSVPRSHSPAMASTGVVSTPQSALHQGPVAPGVEAIWNGAASTFGLQAPTAHPTHRACSVKAPAHSLDTQQQMLSADTSASVTQQPRPVLAPSPQLPASAAAAAAASAVVAAAWAGLSAGQLLPASPALPHVPQAAIITKPSLTRPLSSDGDAQSDAECDLAPAAANNGAAAGAAAAAAARKANAGLQPAVYTGPMEDVVVLSDQPPEDPSKLVCQVAGCGKDLTGFKDYHQRYRICDVHIKLPQVLKDGRLQRFCQQCGRFHDLAAFDANRKSCREQLNKHNARRRRRAQIEAQKTKAIEQLAGSAAIATALAGADGGGNPGGNGGGGGPSDGPGAAAAAVAGAAGGVGDASNDVGRLLSGLMQNPSHLHALRLLLGVQTNPALPAMQPYTPETALPTQGLVGGLASALGAAPAAATATEPASYGLARDVVDCKGSWAPQYESEHRALRISMKLFNRTPADLPPDLREQLTGWLAAMPAALSGAIRPGCVFLTLQLLLDQHAYEDAVARGLSSLLHHLRTNTHCALWHEGAYVIQLASEMALVAGGRVTAYYRDPSGPTPTHPVTVETDTNADKTAASVSCCGGMVPQGLEPATEQGKAGSCDAEMSEAGSGKAQRYPSVTHVAPLCVVAPATGVGKLRVRLEGSDLATQGCELVVRQQGVQLRVPLRASPCGTAAIAHIPFAAADASPGPAAASGVAAALSRAGVVWLEVARGAWMSPPKPLLVLRCDAPLAAEVSELTAAACRADLTAGARDALLVDFGMVLAHASSHDGSAADAAGLTDCFAQVDHATVSHKARRLLLFACDMGWAALAARVLPLATRNCACATEVVAAVHASSAAPAASPAPRGGLSLLHRVVRSGNLALLQGVLHWGKVAGYVWRADRDGPGGITPLHLAALQEDPRIVLALLDYAPAGAFTGLQAHDGTTPFHLAFQMGHYTLDTLTTHLADNRLLPSTDLSAALAAAVRAAGAKARGARPAMAAPTAASAAVGAAEQEEVIAAGGPHGREADPCGKCQCKLPPLVLSVAAACATCGERVPCLGPLDSCEGSGGAGAHHYAHHAHADPGEGHGAVGHDAERCAGCATEQQRRRVADHHPAAPVVGRKRSLTDAYCDGPAAVATHDHSVRAAGGGVSGCTHQLGSVFSITALCQGCHTNRTLEVM